MQYMVLGLTSIAHVHWSNKAQIIPVTFFPSFLFVSLSLSLLRRTGVPQSERDCTDVNGILLMLSATPDTSASEATGSVDSTAATIFRTGSRQSGSGTLNIPHYWLRVHQGNDTKAAQKWDFIQFPWNTVWRLTFLLMSLSRSLVQIDFLAGSSGVKLREHVLESNISSSFVHVQSEQEKNCGNYSTFFFGLDRIMCH